jgi:hypothetical protein
MPFPDRKLPYWAHNIDVYVIPDVLKPSLIHSKNEEKKIKSTDQPFQTKKKKFQKLR